LPELLLRVLDDVFQIGQIIPNMIAHEANGHEVYGHEVKDKNPEHVENYHCRPA
jgi:hypothetical protein